MEPKTIDSETARAAAVSLVQSRVSHGWDANELAQSRMHRTMGDLHAQVVGRREILVTHMWGEYQSIRLSLDDIFEQCCQDQATLF